MAAEAELAPSRLTLLPRLLNRQQAAEYCNISPSAFSNWVRSGKLPPSLPGTTRWDLKAIDFALDAMSGLQQQELSALDGGQTVRVVLKGIHKVKMRLATGEVKTYYYAWRGGPQIRAKPGTPDFVGTYNEAHAQLRQPRAGTLMTIIAQYKASPEFTRLAPSSRRAYLIYIKLIENEFGDLPLAALADRRVPRRVQDLARLVCSNTA
jgi:hypothetical protein